MDDSVPHCRRHRLQAVLRSIGRYRKVLFLRVAYGAATATGTTAVGLIAVILQRHL